ncbi:lipopolysaccharide biosynthesis [Clostridium sp. CAG:571]|nr:lipopolysaccharide biosynthesis [Clostridium sp. CAG:571]HJJ07509.1 Wzz/FepE/Etk N-terminal domain-containing protein [Clostridiaceae bacterium]
MEELDLKQLVNIFWNKRLHVISIVLIFLIIGTVYTFLFVTPKYKSYTSLVLARSESTKENETDTSTITQTDITLNQKLVSTYSELVKSKNVLREVIKNLNINESEENLKDNITVSAVKDTELIQITVTNYYPDRASDIANEIAKVFTKKVGEIYNINNVYIVDEAERANTPYNINHIKDIAIFIAIGLIVSVGYVLISNLLDTTVKSAEDIEKELGVVALASIPLLKDDTKKMKGGII